MHWASHTLLPALQPALPQPRHRLTSASLLAAQVFELNMWKAWSAVFVAVTSFAASLYLISICPAPLLPFAWALSGTAMTGVSRRRWRQLAAGSAWGAYIAK